MFRQLLSRRLKRRRRRGRPYTHRVDVYVDLVRYRELFGSLFRRDFRARYKGSVLGVAWSLANPLILMGVYLLLFSVLWSVVDTIDHYPLYLLSGLAVWVFFATSLQSASRSMVDYSELIRKVRFPRQLVAFSTVATQLVAFGAMLAVLIVIDLIVLPRTRGVFWVAIPLAALIVCLVAGLALADRLGERRLPRHRAHRLRGAPALVLPHAGPVHVRPVRGAPDAAAAAALGEPDHAADRGAARPALPRPVAALDGRALHDRRRSGGAGARRLGLQPRRRPHRGRAVASQPWA